MHHRCRILISAKTMFSIHSYRSAKGIKSHRRSQQHQREVHRAQTNKIESRQRRQQNAKWKCRARTCYFSISVFLPMTWHPLKTVCIGVHWQERAYDFRKSQSASCQELVRFEGSIQACNINSLVRSLHDWCSYVPWYEIWLFCVELSAEFSQCYWCEHANVTVPVPV